MAGVTDVVFRTLCKELGADVMVTEFVSSEGIIRRDDRTRKYTEFTEEQRPVGVQLFGANPDNMAEAAKKVVDWKRPDFIDINFGCPVKKVVSKNGGSSLLKDCPLLAKVAETVARSVSLPVTAKIRIGWDERSINAATVAKTLEEVGIEAVSVHGRTRSQGYSGKANWEVIAACAQAVSIPVIGNGDLAGGADVKYRRDTTRVSGVMIGRSAMPHPWIFREAKHYLETGELLPPVIMEERWAHILRHVRMALNCGRYGDERHTMQAMRSRLMAYSKGLPAGKRLRARLAHVGTVMELEGMAAEYLAHQNDGTLAA